MELTYFLKGIVIGFALAAPVGPVGILCIRRTITDGERHGFMTGLSAASSDMVYSIIAVFGVTLISNFITEQQNWIRIIGGIFLLALGYHSFRSKQSNDKVPNKTNGHTLSFVSTFFLTFTNPLTLFAFAAVFASIGIEKIAEFYHLAILLIAGVFLGSFMWFSFLIELARIFKEKITNNGLTLVNRISGLLLILIGAIVLWNGLHSI
jgi:threonine/homoserine/homoserine lactone efflux protein